MIDYVNEAIRTESIDLFSVDHPRLLHAAIGMSTEVSELLLADDQTNVKEEFGDVLWYTAIVAATMEVTYDELFSLADETMDHDPIKSLVKHSSDALDQIKKVCFYGTQLDEVKFCRSVANVIWCIDYLATEEEWTLSELQETNIAKLRKRYPDKFTTEAALNRDTEAEREAVGV